MVDPRPLTPVYIDACNEAAAAFYAGDWVHVPWRSYLPEARELHITAKEVLALEPACQRWAPLFAHRKVVVHSDNQAAVSQINKGSSKCPLVMQSLRRIFWLSAIFNFRLHCEYLPGVDNNLADAASRYHESGGQVRLSNLLAHYFSHAVPVNRFTNCSQMNDTYSSSPSTSPSWDILPWRTPPAPNLSTAPTGHPT